MPWVDGAAIGLGAISTLLGIYRGLIREALSLLVWVLAVVGSFSYGGQVAGVLQPKLASWPAFLVGLLAYGGLFLTILFLGNLMTLLLRKACYGVGLSGLDRFLGGCFGLVRAALIVAVIAVGLQVSPFAQESWWRQSLLSHWGTTLLASQKVSSALSFVESLSFAH